MVKRALLNVLFICFYLPLLKAEGFVRNMGQWQGAFEYKASLPNGAIFLEEGALTFHLFDPERRAQLHDRTVSPDDLIAYHAFKLRFVGANPDVNFEEEEQQAFYHNYYLGNDPRTWVRKVHPVKTVVYRDLYDGIDLRVEHQGQTIKYEFVLEPGADPGVIQIATEGLDQLSLDREGNLIMRTSIEDLVESKPYIYQSKRDKKNEVDGAFDLSGDTIRYSIPSWNDNLPLVIDPTIIFSTYSGSSSDNWGFTAAPDKNGYLYSGGIIFGTGYPTTTGAYDQSFNFGNYDVAITKYDTSGTQLIFSTYLGGNEPEQPHSMIVNSTGNLYVMGSTGSSNFPTSSTAYDGTFNGGSSVSVFNSFPDGTDIFVTGFNGSGTALLGSTFLGGTGNDGLNLGDSLSYNYSDEFRGEINLDEDENVFVSSCTFSTDFPIVSGFDNTHNGGQDAVVANLNPTLSTLIWSTYLGGSGTDAAYGVDVAEDGTVYVGGGTSSDNFPTTSNAMFSAYQGGRADGFIVHLNGTGTSLLHGTYYGSDAYDQIYFMQLDRANKPHFFGQTEHAGNDLISNANWSDFGGGQILGVLRPDLSEEVWTTQFGSTPGQPNISPTAFLVDVCNSVYISGWGGNLNSVQQSNNATNVAGLETTFDAFQATPDSDDSDFYLAVVAADGNSLVFGSFYGGAITDDHVDGGTSRFDRGGQIYHSVCASCQGFNDFPIEPDPGAWSTTNNSANCNNAVVKIDFELPIIVADFDIPDFACAPFTINIQNNSITQSSSSFFWDLGNGQTTTMTNPSLTLTQKGTYSIQLIINDPTSCNLSDTLIREITIAVDTNFTLPTIDRCIGETAILGPEPSYFDNIGNATISWQPTAPLDDPTAFNPNATVTNSTLFRLVIDYGGCQERILQQVNIDDYPLVTSNDTIVCSSFTPFLISGRAVQDTVTYEWSDDPSFVNLLTTDSVYPVETLSDPLNYFYFRTTKANGCQMLDTVLVTVSDLDIALTADTTICKNALTRISAVSENPLNTFHYFWSTSGYTSDTNETIAPTNQSFLELSLDEAQTYYLRAVGIAADGCTAEDSVRVDVSGLDASQVEATAEVDSFYIGQEIQLNGTPTGPGIDHYWTPNKYISDPLISNPTVRPKEAMMYIWVVGDSAVQGCTFRDTVFVRPFSVVCDTPNVFVPSAFSPSVPDGINDVLYVRGLKLKEVEFSVFDRWGNEVFYSTDQAQGWDGTFLGQEADNAVYVYQLKAVCIDNQEYYVKGNVTKL